MTPSQVVEVEFLYDFYWRLYQKEQETFLRAFVCKHKIGADGIGEKPAALSPEQVDKILSQMQGMDEATPYRQIEQV